MATILDFKGPVESEKNIYSVNYVDIHPRSYKISLRTFSLVLLSRRLKILFSLLILINKQQKYFHSAVVVMVNLRVLMPWENPVTGLLTPSKMHENHLPLLNKPMGHQAWKLWKQDFHPITVDPKGPPCGPNLVSGFEAPELLGRPFSRKNGPFFGIKRYCSKSAFFLAIWATGNF